MLTRIISGIVGISVVVGVLFLGEWQPLVLAGIFALACAEVYGELLSARGLIRNYKISLPCLVLAALAAFFPDFTYVIGRYQISGYLVCLFLLIIIMFFIMVLNHEKFKFDDLTFVIGTFALITFAFHFICEAIYQDYASVEGASRVSYYIVLILGVPWLADAGAYFGGTFFGKHKLCPKISPKKTVEGAAFGILFGTLGALAIGYVFGFIYGGFVPNYLILLIIGVANSFLSILGDLAFSLIKRNCHIKDYGSIIPGHGGLLDRFDSVIFTAPVVYFALFFAGL
jgi:phosphatidate cytidylyltransferase